MTITAVKIIISFYLLTTIITTPTAIKTEQIPTELPITGPTERNNNWYHITLSYPFIIKLYIYKRLKWFEILFKDTDKVPRCDENFVIQRSV